MAARRPFWKWRHWESIGFCLWPPSTCIWNLKLKFQSKLDLCSGNHVIYRKTDGQTDGRTGGRTDEVNLVYPPSNFVGRGYSNSLNVLLGAAIQQAALTIFERHFPCSKFGFQMGMLKSRASCQKGLSAMRKHGGWGPFGRIPLKWQNDQILSWNFYACKFASLIYNQLYNIYITLYHFSTTRK